MKQMDDAIKKIEAQQQGKEKTAVWHVGEQLKEICCESSHNADIVSTDLDNPEIPAEVTEKLKAEAEAKAAEEASAQIEKKLAEANDKIEAANLARQAAERDAAKAQQTVADLHKQLQMSNPHMAEFKVHFKNVQEEMIKLRCTLDSIIAADADSGSNLSEAMKALVKAFARDFGVEL